MKNGFTAGSKERIEKSVRAMERIGKMKWQPSMPTPMIQAIEGICDTALKSGHPTQMEFAVGKDAEHVKKLRLIVVPDELLIHEEINGEKMCTFHVPEYCGEVKKV